MSEGKVRGVVVAHSGLAQGLVDAVRSIAGLDPDALQPLSNDRLGPDAIRDQLQALLGHGGPAIIFTDLREGSCGIAAQRACVGHPDQVVLTGVNLPMLLDFAMMRHLPLRDLVDRIVDRGRSAVMALPEPE